MTAADLGILCGAVLLPFPTAVLADAFRAGSRADEQTAALLYAALAVLMSLAWLADGVDRVFANALARREPAAQRKRSRERRLVGLRPR